ncbi:MAG: Fic family protein [Bavariicoccus seileri]|uniref:Fic family protein n=1 Tax=Bavariicoccus seileri TaxID=549685 RepID=UPI003F9D21B3
MTLKGIKKLPASVTKDESIQIYKQLAKTNLVIGKMESLINNSLVNESLLSLLSLNESVQSTRIEGTQVTFHNFMEIKDKKELDWKNREVKNYHKALMFGINEIKKNQMPISTRLIKQIHTILMENGRGTSSACGEFRKVQNFIGPNNRIEDAVYIPVPPNEIESYMENLDFFINGENHSSFNTERENANEYFEYDAPELLKMAIAHAQFESIHPFLDGNGRLGRILLVLISVNESLVSSPLFFVSEELEKERIRYYNSLNSIRGENGNWSNWLLFFLLASERMANSIIEKLGNADNLAREGLKHCKTDMQRRIWLSTFSEPITTAKQVSDILNIHPSTAKKGLNFLTDIHLLDKDTSRQRNQGYYNYDLMRTISS